MASVDNVAARGIRQSSRRVTSQVHVINGWERSGRIRRAELARRYFDSRAVLVGSLDDECRCAGLGLRVLGSAPSRSICDVLEQLDWDDQAGEPRAGCVCSWSIDVALNLAARGMRSILIANELPPRGIEIENATHVDVIAPDAEVARAWSWSGSPRTRILAPCGLAAGAPVTRNDGDPLVVGLVPSPQGTAEHAIDLVHRAGLMSLGGSAVRIQIQEDGPFAEPMLQYARQTGYGQDIDAIPGDGFPGDLHVAMIDGVRVATNDEQVLDLAARGVIVLAYVDEISPADAEASVEESGYQAYLRHERNAGTRALLQLAEDVEHHRSVSNRARSVASGRDPGRWCDVLGAAIESIQEELARSRR